MSDLDVLGARLADKLDQRAAAFAAADDGLDRIRGRIRRRARRRRATWAGATAVLVLLVALTTGLAVGGRDERSTSYVGVDGGVDDIGPLPLLGFDDPDWRVVSFWPGHGALVIDDGTVESSNAINLRITLDTDPSEERRSLRQVTVDERTFQVGTLSWPGQPLGSAAAVWWSPAPGYTAVVQANSTEAAIGDERLLATAAATIVVNPSTWLGHLGFGPLTEPGSGSAVDPPGLVLSPDAGTTEITSVIAGSTSLTVTPTDSPPFDLTALSPNTEWSESGSGRPVPVRGVEGTYVEVDDINTSEPYRQVGWQEDGRTYIASVPPGLTVEQATAVLAQLEQASPTRWHDLLFPAEPPERQSGAGAGD